MAEGDDREQAAIKNAAATLNAFAPRLSEVGKQIVLALGWVSKYGVLDDWVLGDGRASWNWGAIAPNATDAILVRTVTLPDGSEKNYQYAAFTSQFAGLSALFQRWIDSATYALIDKGDVNGFVRALHSKGFFPQTTPALIEQHTQLLENNVEIVSFALDQPNHLKDANVVAQSATSSKVSLAPLLIGGLAVGILIATLRVR